MTTRPLRHVDLYSDAGRLEALYRDIESPTGISVVCHPHPLHGGTLHNKVVFRAARGLEAAGVATLRFNFRGAGTSQGAHDAGEGEQRDFTSALDWVQKKNSGLPIIVGGFSFGSWVASRVACDLPSVAAIFLIGAPANKYDLRYLQTCDKPTLFLHGSKDEYGDPDKIESIAGQSRNSEAVIVTDAGHFFDKQLDILEETMREWATRVLQK